jgi:AcrR family transcriptional regulator
VSNGSDGETRVTRRRADALIDAIGLATLAELAEHGYAGVTFEGVARRARTSKPVLYRRYRSRAHLVTSALFSSGVPDQCAGTGSLRGDLIALLNSLAARFEVLGIETIRSLIGESDDELRQVLRVLTGEAVDKSIRHFLEMARDRGEIGPIPVTDRVVHLPIALLRQEMVYQCSSEPTAVTDLIDDIYLPLLRQVTGPVCSASCATPSEPVELIR